MEKTTLANLKAIVSRINRLTGSPEESYTHKDGRNIANVGNYHLDGAYGGYSLCRMANESGGTSDVLRVGHVSKPELKKLLFAFIEGIYTAENLSVKS